MTAAPAVARINAQNGSNGALGSGFETITPEYARHLLSRNKVNRRLDDKVAARYARDMRARQWHVTGEAICIDLNGDLRQGQHRLKGCVLADVPFTTLVVRGIEPEAQIAMDSGKKRSLGDQLRLLGEKNTAELGTTIGVCWAYDHNALPHRTLTPSRAEAVAWLGENPGVRDSVALGKRVTAQLPINRTVVSFCHYVTARVDSEAADRFFSNLVSGIDLQDGDPILALRRWIDPWATKRDKPAPMVHAHAVLKCCNYWRSGQTLQFVKVVAAEDFPRVWGSA